MTIHRFSPSMILDEIYLNFFNNDVLLCYCRSMTLVSFIYSYSKFDMLQYNPSGFLQSSCQVQCTK